MKNKNGISIRDLEETENENGHSKGAVDRSGDGVTQTWDMKSGKLWGRTVTKEAAKMFIISYFSPQ